MCVCVCVCVCLGVCVSVQVDVSAPEHSSGVVAGACKVPSCQAVSHQCVCVCVCLPAIACLSACECVAGVSRMWG